MNLPAPHLHHNDYDYGCAYNWVAIRKWHNTWFSNYLVVIFHNFIFSGYDGSLTLKTKFPGNTSLFYEFAWILEKHTFNWRITVARWHLEPNNTTWWWMVEIHKFFHQPTIWWWMIENHKFLAPTLYTCALFSILSWYKPFIGGVKKE